MADSLCRMNGLVLDNRFHSLQGSKRQRSAWRSLDESGPKRAGPAGMAYSAVLAQDVVDLLKDRLSSCLGRLDDCGAVRFAVGTAIWKMQNNY